MTTKFRPGDAVEIGVIILGGKEWAASLCNMPKMWRRGVVRAVEPDAKYPYRVEWEAADGLEGRDYAAERYLRSPAAPKPQKPFVDAIAALREESAAAHTRHGELLAQGRVGSKWELQLAEEARAYILAAAFLERRARDEEEAK